MQMPGRHGFATETGDWHGSYGYYLPDYISVNFRNNNTPPEYTARIQVALDNGFSTGASSDNYVVYISDSAMQATADSAYQLVGGGYRYQYNGKELDYDMDGPNYDYGFRIYDSRSGRFLSIDPLTQKYPWYTPYQYSGNSPIYFIDIDGLEPGKKGTVNSTNTKYTDEELKKNLQLNLEKVNSGLSVDYMTTMAAQEGLSLKMYDRDGAKKRGGNATIGFGNLIHYGSIGNVYYDKNALEKEKKYSAGIKFEEAVDLFITETNENSVHLNNWYKNFNIDKSTLTQNERDVLADVFFNSGTENLKVALKVVKENGKQGLIDAIKDGTVSSISDQRKDFRLEILEKNNYVSLNTNTTITASSQQQTPVSIPQLDERNRSDHQEDKKWQRDSEHKISSKKESKN